MRLLQLSCDLQTLNLALIYCHPNLNFVHINFLYLSQVIFQDFLLKGQFSVPVGLYCQREPQVGHVDEVEEMLGMAGGRPVGRKSSR